jgi:hypothetical protein
MHVYITLYNVDHVAPFVSLYDMYNITRFPDDRLPRRQPTISKAEYFCVRANGTGGVKEGGLM